ncbi:hypothetical protein [Yinghuangia soli]|uniref:Uncharacterized protein n=1 Tax=Yinghuangia soli TaxID=2908204 RepID=A0AA41U4D6_9ACTN|nr:hypothetical protein [Yinghuangia soli]MCF2532786.1 hypothetical protein [Yinghuangia soli]
MQLRWDWLASQITVPYVPTLGPVHPDVLSARLFAEVVEISRSGAVLPYDKDRRWADSKAERILPGPLVHTPTDTVLATSTTGRRAGVTVYHYGSGLGAADVMALAKDCARDLAMSDVRTVWFSTARPDVGSVHAVGILVNDLGGHRAAVSGGVVDLAGLPAPVRASLADLAREPENAGFAFLAEQFAAGRLNGRFLRSSNKAAWPVRSAPSESWLTRSVGRCCSRRTSASDPSFEAGASAATCGGPPQAGAAHTAPRTSWSSPNWEAPRRACT